MRRTALRRTGGTKKRIRELPPALRELNRELAYLWHQAAQRRPCAVCGAKVRQTHIHGHHIIERQWIDGLASERGWSDEAWLRVTWNTMNSLSLCALCHTRHHNHRCRVDQTVLRKHAPKVWRFVRQLDIEWMIDRHYPGVAEA